MAANTQSPTEWTVAMPFLSRALLQQLNIHNVTSHSVIAVGCRSRQLLAALICILPKIGYAVQPLNIDWPISTIKKLLNDSGASILIADRVIDGIAIPIFTTVDLIALANQNIEYLSHSALPANAIQLIIATSGSEGVPKAVMLTGNNIAAAVAASFDRIPLCDKDRWLCCLPLYHIGGIAILQRCMQVDATVVILDSGNGVAIAQALKQYVCTHVSLVPAMLARLLEVMPNPPVQLKCALIGGAALNPKLAQRALAQHWPLCISYGMSETGSQCATLCNPQLSWPGQLVGLPVMGMQIRIDEETGRIQVRGPMLMAGYANPQRYWGFGIAEDGWLQTADLGYLDAVGQLLVMGRADQVLISGGVKVDPVQLEMLLCDCPGVDEIAISGRIDSVWGEIIVAVFVGTIAVAEFSSWCRQHIPSALRPRELIKVAALPRTNLEKIDRVALRTLLNLIVSDKIIN